MKTGNKCFAEAFAGIIVGTSNKSAGGFKPRIVVEYSYAYVLTKRKDIRK